MLNSQNSNFANLGSRTHDSCERNSRKEKAQIGVKITSFINEIVSSGIEGGLTLDVYIRMECGRNAMWEMLVQSIVIKPGPDVDPIYELGH